MKARVQSGECLCGDVRIACLRRADRLRNHSHIATIFFAEYSESLSLSRPRCIGTSTPGYLASRYMVRTAFGRSRPSKAAPYYVVSARRAQEQIALREIRRADQMPLAREFLELLAGQDYLLKSEPLTIAAYRRAVGRLRDRDAAVCSEYA